MTKIVEDGTSLTVNSDSNEKEVKVAQPSTIEKSAFEEDPIADLPVNEMIGDSNMDEDKQMALHLQNEDEDLKMAMALQEAAYIGELEQPTAEAATKGAFDTFGTPLCDAEKELISDALAMDQDERLALAIQMEAYKGEDEEREGEPVALTESQFLMGTMADS